MRRPFCNLLPAGVAWLAVSAVLLGAAWSLTAPESVRAQQSGINRKAIDVERSLGDQAPAAPVRPASSVPASRSGREPLQEEGSQQKMAASQSGAGLQGTGLPGGTESTQEPVIVGRVLYKGLVPAPLQLEVNRDQDVCGVTVTATPLSVDPASHGLRNAIIHVESGAGVMPVEEASPASVAVRNTKCRFQPHVSAMQTGSAAEIINDDPVMHNTNMTFANRTVLNVAVVAGGASIRKPIKRSGLHIVKCNVHKFMQAYRMVFDDPFFDQTTETGQFRIAGVAPGPQTITVWHETLGTLQKEIQVPPRGTVIVELEYK